MIITHKNGQQEALQDKWLRVTQNPVAEKYPKTGDLIQLKDHPMLAEGEYRVLMVTEFEPPYHPDEDGRDIRLTLLKTSDDSWNRRIDMNGVTVRKALWKS